MSGSTRQRKNRIFALLLSILLLVQAMPSLADTIAETQTVEATPTDTLAPTAFVTDSPTQQVETTASVTSETPKTVLETTTPAAAGTQQETTDAPAADTATPEASETPEDSATPEASATPEDSATPEASATPEDSATPEASVTPEGSPSPEPSATVPMCHQPTCAHIALDEHGNMIALCAYGAWLLENEPETAAGMIKPVSVMALEKSGSYSLIDGTTTIYRSGTYTLSGGTPASNLVISDNLAVALILNGARIGRLTIGNDVSMQVDFTARNQIDSMLAGSGSTEFDGTGSLVIAAVDDLGTARFTMRGGSIRLPSGAVSRNGRLPYHCDAAGATSATVDGVGFPFTTSDDSNRACLWLTPLGGGGEYQSGVVGSVLAVRSIAPAPGVTGTFDMDDTIPFTAVAGQSVSILSSGGAPRSHTLLVDQANVTLIFSNASFDGTADVNLTTAARVHVSGTSSLQALRGTTANLTGSGTLRVGALESTAISCAGDIRLTYDTAAGGWQSGWQALDSPINLATVTRLTYGGRAYAIAAENGESTRFYAPLPAPASGMSYDIRASGIELEAIQVPTGTQTLVLTNAGLSITANGNYVIVNDGTVSGGIQVASGVQATLLLRTVRTTGGIAIGANANCTLSLEGSSSFGGSIALGSGATFAVGGTGALYVSAVTAAGAANVSIGANTNLTLASGTSLGGSNLVRTVINVTNAVGTPVRDAAISLKIGRNAPFTTTTAANGHVTLWRSRALTNMAVVVLSSANTYADILDGNPANPNALPQISGVTIHRQGYVTFTTTGAQTYGIQVYINRSGAVMPDTFDASALQVPRLAGECNIPGLRAGDQVTFRAYAARLAGQTLSAETADGFQFSEAFSFTVTDLRTAFTLADQSKEYDRKAFGFRSGQIPSGATVTYYHGSTQLSAAPVDVGQYTAAVSIPAGHAKYLPGVTVVKVTIERKVIYIYPEPAGKLMGQEDPPFDYSYDALYGRDEITGPLGRQSGEEPGNYPYHTDWLVAPDYYRLVIDPESPMFFIDWEPGHYAPYDPLNKIDPIHQVIVFSDGMKLDLVLRTGDKLNISGVGYGEMVNDPRDRKTRPFTPELRLKRGYDQAMLILQAEPDIRSDGGYETDADGKTIVSPRALTLSGYQLSRFQRQRITTLGFRLENVLVMLELAELSSDAVAKAIANAGMPKLGTRYQIVFTPVNSVSDLAEQSIAAQDAKALGAQMMDVRVQAINGMQTLDISNLLPSARMAFNVSSLLESQAETTPAISEVTIGRGEGVSAESITTDVMDLVQQLTQEQLVAQGVKLYYYGAKVLALDSRLVVPYTASEAETLAFTAIMRTNPFLMVRHERNGLYGLTKTLVP